MGESYGAEERLRELASKLRQEADELEQAADVLRTLRDSDEHVEEIKAAKEWAKSWMRR